MGKGITFKYRWDGMAFERSEAIVYLLAEIFIGSLFPQSSILPNPGSMVNFLCIVRNTKPQER